MFCAWMLYAEMIFCRDTPSHEKKTKFSGWKSRFWDFRVIRILSPDLNSGPFILFGVGNVVSGLRKKSHPDVNSPLLANATLLKIEKIFSTTLYRERGFKIFGKWEFLSVRRLLGNGRGKMFNQDWAPKLSFVTSLRSSFDGLQIRPIATFRNKSFRRKIEYWLPSTKFS